MLDCSQALAPTSEPNPPPTPVCLSCRTEWAVAWRAWCQLWKLRARRKVSVWALGSPARRKGEGLGCSAWVLPLLMCPCTKKGPQETGNRQAWLQEGPWGQGPLSSEETRWNVESHIPHTPMGMSPWVRCTLHCGSNRRVCTFSLDISPSTKSIAKTLCICCPDAAKWEEMRREGAAVGAGGAA